MACSTRLIEQSRTHRERQDKQLLQTNHQHVKWSCSIIARSSPKRNHPPSQLSLQSYHIQAWWHQRRHRNSAYGKGWRDNRLEKGCSMGPIRRIHWHSGKVRCYSTSIAFRVIRFILCSFLLMAHLAFVWFNNFK